jgi:hypothetical protein
MSFNKKLKYIYKSFYYLDANVTMLNECFCYFLFIWLIHMLPWYIKNITI